MSEVKQYEIVEAIKTMIRLLEKGQAENLHDFLYDYCKETNDQL